jgi:outer membrane protein assembly factor BamA
MFYTYAFPALIFLVSALAFAQRVEPDSAGKDRSGWMALPFGFYTPETSVALGGGAIFYFRDYASLDDTKPSQAAVTAYYTFNKQYRLELSPKLYLENERYYFGVNFEAGEYPMKYFGVGNETRAENEEIHTPRYLRFRAIGKYIAYERLHVGPMIVLETRTTVEKEPGGLLDRGAAPGAEGGALAGFGFNVARDLRDNSFSPRSGSYHEARGVFYTNRFLGEYAYQSFLYDSRKYFPIGGHTVAVQAYAKLLFGDVPFYELAELGGVKRMRGYYQGRYRDKLYLAGQIEYRTPFWNRFAFAAFGGVGETAAAFGAFRIADAKLAGGFGLRFLFIESERIDVRADVAFGANGAHIYVDIGEAF